MGNFLSTHEYIELENRKEMLYKEQEELEEAHKLLNSKLKRLRTRLPSVDDSTKRLHLYAEIDYYEHQLLELHLWENMTKICCELSFIHIKQDPSILEHPVVKTIFTVSELACLTNELNTSQELGHLFTFQTPIICNL